MAFSGFKKEKDRNDHVIAYLKEAVHGFLVPLSVLANVPLLADCVHASCSRHIIYNSRSCKYIRPLYVDPH